MDKGGSNDGDKNIILELRTQRGMSQNELTEHIPITIWMN